MKLPFGWRLENRASIQTYTDGQVSQQYDRATGSKAISAGATAAVEAVSGLLGRSFAVAQVSGSPMVAEALTPSFMEMTARSLVRRGEALYLIRTSNGSLELLPSTHFDIEGPADSRQWRYNLDLNTPTNTEIFTNVPADMVLHIRVNVDPNRPWQGLSATQHAYLSGKLSAEVIAALGDEQSGPRGLEMMTPKDGDDTGLVGLRDDITAAKGRLVMVESGDLDNPGGGRMMGMVSRFGAEPPQSTVMLMERAFNEILSAYGVPPAMFGLSDGTLAREANRQLLNHCISPMGRVIQSELRDKLSPDIGIEHGELMASDSQGKARAFQSLVGGGMEIERAVALSGLMVSND